MADSPIASMLFYGRNTPVRDFLTNDHNLQVAQYIALGVSAAAAVIGTGGVLGDALPGLLGTAGTGTASTVAPAATGGAALAARNPELLQQAQDEIAAFGPDLAQAGSVIGGDLDEIGTDLLGAAQQAGSALGDDADELGSALGEEADQVGEGVSALGEEVEDSLPTIAERAAVQFHGLVQRAQGALRNDLGLVMLLGNKGHAVAADQLFRAAGLYVVGRPGMAYALVGNTMEALVEALIAELPEEEQLIEHLGGPGKVDFVGVKEFAGLAFELTTEAGVAAHATREYIEGVDGAMIFTYVVRLD